MGSLTRKDSANPRWLSIADLGVIGGSSLFSIGWPRPPRLGATPFVAPPLLHRGLTVTSPLPLPHLTVVPLIAYQRYYGEVTVRIRCSLREGLVRGWRNRRLKARFWRNQAGSGGLSQRQETGQKPLPIGPGPATIPSKTAKGPRRPEAHELGNGHGEQNSTFPLEGTHSTNQPAKARTVSTGSNGNAAHHIARHVTRGKVSAFQRFGGCRRRNASWTQRRFESAPLLLGLN